MIDFNNPVQPGFPPNQAAATAPPIATGTDPFQAQAAAAQAHPQSFNPNPTQVQMQRAQVPGMQPAMPTHVDVDEMENGFQPIPDGTYQFRLATIGGGPSSNNPTNMVVTATFEVVQGEYAGREHRKYYTLTPKWDAKKQKWNSRGIADAREDMKLFGIMPPKMFPTDPTQAAQLIGAAFQQAGVFTGMVKTERYTPKTGPKAGQPQEFADLKMVGTGGIKVTGAGGGNPFGL